MFGQGSCIGAKAHRPEGAVARVQFEPGSSDRFKQGDEGEARHGDLDLVLGRAHYGEGLGRFLGEVIAGALAHCLAGAGRTYGGHEVDRGRALPFIDPSKHGVHEVGQLARGVQISEKVADGGAPVASEGRDDLVEDLVLRGEVVVKRGRGHACLGGDIGHRDLVGRLNSEQFDRGGENLVAP